MSDAAMSEQEKQWDHLYTEMSQTLQRFGQEDAFGGADYWLLDDNWGNHQQKVEIQNLNLIRPEVVSSLQKTLVDFPDWEIVVAVDVPGHETDWPAMGLIIRGHEIIDGLRRQYFPTEFQNIEYENSRRGTDRD
jgi:hypothetical protein